MYVMTSLSRMFARIVVLTFVASNERQARLFTPRGCCPNVQVHARVLLLTFRSDFQRPFEFEDSRNVFKTDVFTVRAVAKRLKIVPFPSLQNLRLLTKQLVLISSRSSAIFIHIH